jgi:sortase A
MRPPALRTTAGGLIGRRRARVRSLVMVAGVLLLAYAAIMVLRGDPLTAGYTAWQQRKLERELAAVGLSPHAAAAGGTASAARAFAAALEPGDPVGRIRIPSIGLDRIIVYGTGGSELAKGPGHYDETPLPGAGGTPAIAGHRTTFGAPFRHLDALERGERIVLELPYASFRYVAIGHEIVADDDWTILRDRGFETLVLTACHPLYGSSHRWVVYARLEGAS